MPCCFHDGFSFEGEGYRMPIKRRDDGSYDVMRQTFCSLACMLAWALESRSVPDHQFAVLNRYVREKYGITKIITAPKRAALAAYDVDGVGLSIEELRDIIRQQKMFDILPIHVIPHHVQEVWQTDITVHEQPDKTTEDGLLRLIKRRRT